MTNDQMQRPWLLLADLNKCLRGLLCDGGVGVACQCFQNSNRVAGLWSDVAQKSQGDWLDFHKVIGLMFGTVERLSQNRNDRFGLTILQPVDLCRKNAHPNIAIADQWFEIEFA